MKYIYVFLLLTVLFFSCHREEVKVLSDEEKMELLKNKNDSIMVVFDSLMSIKINIPHVIDQSIIDSTCNSQFTELAKRTDGNMTILVSAKYVSKEIINIIENNSKDNTDILFLIDKTSSMLDDIDNIKKGLNNVISSLEKFKNNRLAIACYGDKNVDGAQWYNYKNFESNFKEAKSFVNLISVTDGGDYPESFFDAFFETMNKEFWKSETKRIIILIGDAPSLNPPLASHSLEDVIQKAKEYKITMNFYPILISPYDTEFLGDVPRMEELNLIDNMYPNPSNGLVNFNFTKNDEYTIELYDVEGKLIKSEQIISDSYKADLYNLPNGIYVFQVLDKYKNHESKKLILQK